MDENDKKKKKGERRTSYEVSAKTFALTWNRAGSAEEAAQKLEMPLPIVLARVSRYRKGGMKLKRMPRKNSRGFDVEYINKLCDDILKNEGRPLSEKAAVRRLADIPLNLLLEAVNRKAGS